ncbi:HD domain-containing protein [Escherichia coli]
MGRGHYRTSWFYLAFPRIRYKSRWEMPASLASYAAQDKQAREEWISVLEALFLTPAGLSINDIPPDCSSLLAGFCSLADWLGS